MSIHRRIARGRISRATKAGLPALRSFQPGTLLDVPDALHFLEIPDTKITRALMHEVFCPMPADEFWMIPRVELEAFAKKHDPPEDG